jgi:hypothetical protein
MKNCIKIFAIILIISGCSSSVETIYKSETVFSFDPAIKKLNAESLDKSIVFFTNCFAKDSVEIRNGNTMLYKNSLETIAQIGLAKLQVVSNLENVEISIPGRTKKRLILKAKDLKKYKYVYISKDDYKSKKDYLVEFTNKAKAFL